MNYIVTFFTEKPIPTEPGEVEVEKVGSFYTKEPPMIGEIVFLNGTEFYNIKRKIRFDSDRDDSIANVAIACIVEIEKHNSDEFEVVRQMLK